MTTREVYMQCEIPEVYRVALTVDSEDLITGAKLEGGFASRGLGRLVAGRHADLEMAIFVIERICGICSHAHTMAFSEAVERALGIDVPPRAAALRTIVAELERMQSHTLNLAETADEVGARRARDLAWAVRAELTKCLLELTGNRIHYGMNRIGGVTQDVFQKTADALGERLSDLRDMVDRLGTAYEDEARRAIEGVGRWEPTDSEDVWGTGPNGRAAGVETDVRVETPYSAYRWLRPVVIVEHGGCAWARSLVRLRELRGSRDLVLRLLSDLPSGDIQVEEIPAAVGECHGEATVEAPRGANRHRVGLTSEGRIERLSIEVPTPRSIGGLERALISEPRRHAMRIVASFDLCMSCADGAP